MKTNVGVFFGGKSVEHEVSVISALQAIGAIDKEIYHVVPVYIAKTGEWYSGDTLLEIERYKNTQELLRSASKVHWKAGEDGGAFLLYPERNWWQAEKPIRIDVALPVLHGTYGEDGCMQGLFELAGVPYAGCDVLSSACGMDKIVTKGLLKMADIPVIDFTWFYLKEWVRQPASLQNSIKQLGFPLIVKPANLGSSVGIAKAQNAEELETAIATAGSFSQRIIVEKMVEGLREINCSVVGDYEHAEVSVCEEPLRQGAFLSYEDKYLSSGGSKTEGQKGMASTKREIPANLTADLEEKVKYLAKKTFQTLGCAGVSRIDFILDTKDNHLYVNEINTIPGSLSFYLWEPSGKKFGQLVQDLIDTAFKTHREKGNLMFTYDTNIFQSFNAGKAGKK
ncbi:MAG: D-alanine--D-alanine ligase family protein [Saprospiraceae bacterium]